MNGAQASKANQTYQLPGTKFFDVEKIYESEIPGSQISVEEVERAMKYLNRSLPQIFIGDNRKDKRERKFRRVSEYIRDAKINYRDVGFGI